MATLQLRPDDTLRCAENQCIQKILAEQGDNQPKAEQVILSVHITKINRRGKEQDRILLLTNKALYNLRASRSGQWQCQSTQSSHTHYNCRRRVHLSLIETISIPSSLSVSDEFIIHIPSEYDYRFKSSWHLHIANTIASQCTIVRGKAVKVKRLEDNVDTEQAVISKKQAKRLSTENARKFLLQSQQASITKQDAFTYYLGDVLCGEVIDSMETTVAKAKSYALKLDECAGFCFQSNGDDVEETVDTKYKMQFKTGPVLEVDADEMKETDECHSYVIAENNMETIIEDEKDIDINANEDGKEDTE